MKFKKVMALVLASAMVFSMAACGGDSGSSGRQRKKIPVTAVNPTAVNYLFLSGIQIRSRA